MSRNRAVLRRRVAFLRYLRWFAALSAVSTAAMLRGGRVG